MVPGLLERERLAADLRRLEWLAEATLGPAPIACQGATAYRREPRPALPIGLWRRGLSSARVLGRRIRLLHPTPEGAIPDHASAPVC